MPVKVFIVDDEAHIRDELKFMLGRYNDIEVVGEADNAFDAILHIQKDPPDAVLLDIRLGDVDGMALARKIRDTQPGTSIVFVTALDNCAAEGFELDAVDYVLKPVSEERLDKTVERLLQKRHLEPGALSFASNTGKLAVKHNHIWKLVSIDDICFFQSQEHCTCAHTQKDVYQLNYTLRELEEQLGSKSFLRVHKSFILNLNYIDVIMPWFNYTCKVTLKGMTDEVPISRSYVKRFKEHLNL